MLEFIAVETFILNFLLGRFLCGLALQSGLQVQDAARGRGEMYLVTFSCNA